MAKPQPIPKDMICSECGLDWDVHPKNPRRRDCIDLLKARVPRPYVPRPFHYCNWGHPNCWTHHSNQIYWYSTTGNNTTRSFDFSGNTVSTVSASNVIEFKGRDDDPDMGVTANVG